MFGDKDTERERLILSRLELNEQERSFEELVEESIKLVRIAQLMTIVCVIATAPFLIWFNTIEGPDNWILSAIGASYAVLAFLAIYRWVIVGMFAHRHRKEYRMSVRIMAGYNGYPDDPEREHWVDLFRLAVSLTAFSTLLSLSVAAFVFLVLPWFAFVATLFAIASWLGSLWSWIRANRLEARIKLRLKSARGEASGEET